MAFRWLQFALELRSLYILAMVQNMALRMCDNVRDTRLVSIVDFHPAKHQFERRRIL